MSDETPPPPSQATHIPNYNEQMTLNPRHASSAGALYVTQDDTLVLRVFSPTVANTWRLSLRYQSPQGEVRPEFFSGSILTTGIAPFVQTIPGSEGYLLSATIETPGAFTGQVYVELALFRGSGSGDSTFGHVLIAGYPGPRYRIGYPLTPQRQPSEGRGFLIGFTIGDPVAPTFASTVPAGEQWTIKAINYQFQASAVAGNRFITMSVDDNLGTRLFRSQTQTVIIANQVWLLSWIDGTNAYVGSLQQHMPLPRDFRVGPGSSISQQIIGGDAGDRATSITLYIERLIAA